jgi:DNA replication protein DnaC
MIAYLDDKDKMALKMCDCKVIRRTLKKIKKSGLKSLLDNYTLANYTTTDSWQEGIKNKAVAYISDCQGKWFYIGGQTSCGKTHICTAIVGEFIKQGKDATYMLWIDKSNELKANKNNSDVYDSLMKELKDIEVLYIDDFFKNEQRTPPTSADVRLAYEILNYRYNNPDLITIISSEYMIKDLLKIDEAVGSRIYQRSKDYQMNIAPDIKKNYRLK